MWRNNIWSNLSGHYNYNLSFICINNRLKLFSSSCSNFDAKNWNSQSRPAYYLLFVAQVVWFKHKHSGIWIIIIGKLWMPLYLVFHPLKELIQICKGVWLLSTKYHFFIIRFECIAKFKSIITKLISLFRNRKCSV